MYFGDWLSRWATYTPEKVAVIDEASERRLSYRTLNQRCDRLAHVLRHRFGIQKGDRVAVLAQNCSEVLELFFAAGKLGAVLVPINWRLAAPEVRYILDDCGPRALFYGPEFDALVREILPQLALEYVVPLAPDGMLTAYEDLLAMASDEVPTPAEIALDDPHLILYTSGTTGNPKGAILTHGTITWNAINTQVGWDLHHDDVTLAHTPFFHTGGLNVLTTPLLHRGGTVVVMRGFDATRSLSLIEQERCTVVFAVPTMFQMLLDAPNFESSDLSSIRFFITGGAPCPVPLIEAYARRGVTFKQGYGLTEAGPNCFTLDAKDSVRKAGSVGFPNMHLDVRVVDDEGKEVATGEIGELLISGPHVFAGYWRNPQATADAIRDGWLHTGDLVRRDEEGYYYIVDRKKDLFISGGENVYPAELEKALHHHPSIHEAAVIGVPDPKWGEVGRAFVVLREGHMLTEAEVLDFLRDRLAKYKIPKSVVFSDALPRNSAGKVVKNALRAAQAATISARG
ncbi:long-chain fatty acid--CoA ligase [bacterium]|nr:long-chain fatty acid--CoA ligase [bacterium]